MWIRSQNKEKLVNADSMCLMALDKISNEKNDNDPNVLSFACGLIDDPNGRFAIVENNLNNIGTYSNKKKALKVLDMIEYEIKQDYLFQKTSSEITKYMKPSAIKDKATFQMPQDNEVI